MVIPPEVEIQISAADRQHIFQSVLSGSYNGCKIALQFMKLNYYGMSLRYESIEAIFKVMEQNVVSEELLNLVHL